MFNPFSKKRPHSETAGRLYGAVVDQARRPEFFLQCGVPDSVDGRFDLIVLHAFMLFHRMKADHEETKDLGQEVFDLMFANLNENLREIGVGDMGIAHRIKDMAQAFYGRVQSYERGLEAEEPHLLEEALRRNLFRKSDPSAEAVRAVADYVRDRCRSLGTAPTAEILSGRIDFGLPPRVAP